MGGVFQESTLMAIRDSARKMNRSLVHPIKNLKDNEKIHIVMLRFLSDQSEIMLRMIWMVKAGWRQY